MRPIKSFQKRLQRDLESMENTMLIISVEEAVKVAVRETPKRGQTRYSTGRARGSIRANAGSPAMFDPGVLPAYPTETKTAVRQKVKARKFGSDMYVDMGVKYAPFVAKIYDPIKKGAVEAERKLEGSRKEILRAGNSS
jgi:hypothetical protein